MQKISIFRINIMAQHLLKTLWKLWITLCTHSYSEVLWKPFFARNTTQSCGFSEVSEAAAGTIFGGDNRT